MLTIAFAVFVFACVALCAYAASAAVVGGDGADRRRIKQRLAGVSDKPQSLQEQSRLLVQENTGRVLTELFGKYSFFNELRLSLKQSMPDLTVERFLGIAGGAAGVMFVFGWLLTSSVIGGGVGLILGGYVPFLFVARKKMKRQKALAEQLPDALDFLGRSLRAGHSLPIGLQMMGTELPSPIRDEFGRCYDEISLGTGPDVALKSMCERIDSTDFAFFVTAVLVQRQTGGDLSQVLDNITGMLRQRIGLQQAVRAKTAEGRFTGLILAAFPMIMFLILFVMSRDYAMPLVTTTIGKGMLLAALLMSALGLYVIKKITTVKV